VDERNDISDEEIMTGWYAYAADEPGFVGYWLNLLCERQSITTDEQQGEFGADDLAFLRLRAMPLPRSQSLASDAHRIAEACGLKNLMAFVQAMILASNLVRATNQSPVQEFYQAAFDIDEDLDYSSEKK
jgi:HPt (histidine-containing phosphotransfer) domain-containing protein